MASFNMPFVIIAANLILFVGIWTHYSFDLMVALHKHSGDQQSYCNSS